MNAFQNIFQKKFNIKQYEKEMRLDADSHADKKAVCGNF
jgi:hypothetical protein